MGKGKFYIEKLNKLHQQNCYRNLSKEDNNELIDLCSNDYLGLSADENLVNEFFSILEKNDFLFSASSSRLLKKNFKVCNEFESFIAFSYKKEGCLLFNSGYHLNVGVISSLAKKQDLIIADKYVHASIIDGAKLSNAQFIRYRHLDYNHLELLLQKNRNLYKNVFIISESLFSMDGDFADLKACLLYTSPSPRDS